MRKQSKRIENKKDDFVERTLNYLNHREKTELQNLVCSMTLIYLMKSIKTKLLKKYHQ